jgi:hypothetical protein
LNLKLRVLWQQEHIKGKKHVCSREILSCLALSKKIVVSIRFQQTDGRTWYPPQACKFLKLEYHLHSTYEKSITIERTIQYIIDRIDNLTITFLAERKKEKL